MSRILESKVIKRGNIVDNYLVNFPEFINKEKNSIYKLVIGLKVTCFVVEIPELMPTSGYVVTLPFGRFELNQGEFISWGDGITRRVDDADNFLVHIYNNPGIYLIYILGDTPNLYNIWDYIYAELYTLILRQQEIEQRKLQIELIENPSQEETEEYRLLEEEYETNNLKITELQTPRNEGGKFEGLDHFFNSLILVRKLSDTLTNLWGTFKNYPNLSAIPDLPLPTSVTTCKETFYGCPKLLYIPFNFDFPEECTDFENMFAWSGLKTIFNLNLRLPCNTNNIDLMFRGTKIESIPLTLFNNVTSALTCISSTFKDCHNLMLFTTTKKFDYITNIDEMFHDCWSLRKITFNLPKLSSLYATCWGCSSLNKIEGFHINLFTKNANYAFKDCYSLNQDISLMLEYWADFNLVNLSCTFYNCLLLRGTPKELYLWKSYTLGHLDSPLTFYNCTLLNNYNFITSGWGGADDVNYWYGSYQVNITLKNDIYCLPLFKFKDGDQKSNFNLNYNIISNQSGILTPYDFYVNYGDLSTWYHVVIQDNPFFNNVWLNDKISPFFGYPLTYKINFPSVGDGQTNYDNLTQNNFFGYIFKNITHVYKEPGKYKIMIMGQMPRFFISDSDTKTNRHIFDIYTINKLPFTTLDHAFTNAINLRYLPNEQLKFFPVLSGESNWANVQVTISGYPVSTNTQLWPVWKDTEKNCIISTALNLYHNYLDVNNWPSYTVSDVDTLSAVTEVSISALTRDDLLHEIPTSGTNYTFATVIGPENYLNSQPPLFEINTSSTTFLNR